MSTSTLMRTASGPVPPHLGHGSRAAGAAFFGWSRTGASLTSPQYLRVFGRERVGSQSDDRVGTRGRRVGAGKTAVGEQDELAVVDRKGSSAGVRSGVGVAAPEGVDEVEFAGGAGGGRRAGGGSGGGGGWRGGKGGREATRAGGRQSEMGAYYHEMLEADPGNPLLLRNYGKFLHEVVGDVEGAEECYGRAILANPGDGEVLSLYGKLIWDAHRDEGRAEAYFERAVEAAPDDCCVLGSYAHFLWDAEEEEERTTSSSSSATSQSSSQHLAKAYRGALL